MAEAAKRRRGQRRVRGLGLLVTLEALAFRALRFMAPGSEGYKHFNVGVWAITLNPKP